MTAAFWSSVVRIADEPTIDDALLFGRSQARKAERHLDRMKREDPERYARLQREWEDDDA